MIKQMNHKHKISLFLLTMALAFCLPVSCVKTLANITENNLPAFSNAAYTVVDNNEPEFTPTEKTRTDAFEEYSELDKLGRCGTAYVNICKELMPTTARDDISSIHPSGWKSGMNWERCHLIGFQLTGESANEKNLITGTHYFNVSGMLPFENMVADYVKETDNHVLYRVTPVYKGGNLIASGVQMEAYSIEDNGDGISFNVFVHNVSPGYKIDYLAGGVAKGNKKINQYIEDGTYSQTISQSKVKNRGYGFKIGCKAPGKVRYKKLSGSSRLSVTTKGKVTVKKGTPAGTYKMKVQISASAYSVYKAKAIKKTVKVVVKPGKSSSTPNKQAISDDTDTDTNTNTDSDSGSPSSGSGNYIVNTNTGKFHYPTCRSVSQMSEKNKAYSTKSRDELIAAGYSPCGICKP